MTADALDRICALLTGVLQNSLKKGNEPQAMAVGMDENGKFDLTAIVLAIPNISNRQATGFAVKALRESDQFSHYAAVGMSFPITLTGKDGKKRDALYVCLEQRNGSAEDIIFTYSKRFFGGYKFDPPQGQKAEARVFGPKGDELVALVSEICADNDQITATFGEDEKE